MSPDHQELLLAALSSNGRFTRWKLQQMGLQNLVEVEDIHQDVVMSILNRKSSSEINNYNAFVRTCILRQLLKIKKIKERELRSSQPVESLLQEVEIPQESDIEVKLRYHLTQLNTLDRKILEYALFEELKAPEIARMLNEEGHHLSAENVRQRKKRAIDRLRQIF